MRVKALAMRILNQMGHDKRTLALMFLAPLLILSLVFLLLDSSVTNVAIAVINAPQDYVDRLYENNAAVIRCDEARAMEVVEKGEATASVNIISGKAYICVDGSNSTKARAALAALEASRNRPASARQDLAPEIDYIYGCEDLSLFDNFCAALIGILVFFFVFLIAGIAFLQERTTGTLERLLSTPIKRWEIVAGYTVGYGIVTVGQSLVISLYVVYVLNVMMIGSLWLVLLITLLSAMCALDSGHHAVHRCKQRISDDSVHSGSHRTPDFSVRHP